MLLIIHHTELSRGHALYQAGGMNDDRVIASALKHRGMILWSVAYLERHGHTVEPVPRVLREEMEVVYREVLLVGGARLIALADIEYVALHVLLHRIPRAATEP